MPPPVDVFPAEMLPQRIQYNEKSKVRKTQSGKRIDLSSCPLSEMLQYNCTVKDSRPGGLVICEPVLRQFRRCMDKKGEFVVETTSWEGLDRNS